MTSVRPAGAADVDAVTAVHEAARRAYYAAGGWDVGAPDPRRRSTWQALVDSRDHGVWLTERAGAVTGVLAAGRPVHPRPDDEPVLELVALYVDPAVWGSGAGSTLHDVFVHELAAGTAVAGVLDVWDGNGRARAFYRRRGWVPDGRSRPGELGTAYLGLRLPSGR
jgi:ribosomal protein S18 acetylase RimI-like enzyme